MAIRGRQNRDRLIAAMAISMSLLEGPAMTQPAPTPTLILYIAREPLVAGRENAYREIEEQTARLSVKRGCPHPYLAMESLTGPKEIWWFNGFESPEDQSQVGEAYEKNVPLSAALKSNRDRKAPFTGKVTEIVAHYRPDLTGGVPWIVGYGRFLVIAVTNDRPSSASTVFQAADGTFFVFSPARTRKQADRCGFNFRFNSRRGTALVQFSGKGRDRRRSAILAGQRAITSPESACVPPTG